MDPHPPTKSPEPTASVHTAPVAEPCESRDFLLHPKAAAVWTGITAFVLTVPAVGGIVATLVCGLWYLAPLIPIAVAALIWLNLGYCRRYVAAFRCTLSPLGLLIVRGVWWRSQTFVPRHRVQHTDVDQGPLGRRFGMATLKVFTAGSEHSEIEIGGLRHEHAIELRDDLIESTGRPS